MKNPYKNKARRRCFKCIKKKNLTPDYIPAKGEEIILRENANLSTGGTAADCTGIIHPDNIEIAVKAAKAIGIDIAGVDIVTEDISKPIWENGGAIVKLIQHQV